MTKKELPNTTNEKAPHDPTFGQMLIRWADQKKYQKFDPENIHGEIERLFLIVKWYERNPEKLPKETQQAISDLMEALNGLSDEEYKEVLSEHPDITRKLSDETSTLLEGVLYILMMILLEIGGTFIALECIRFSLEVVNMVSTNMLTPEKLNEIGALAQFLGLILMTTFLVTVGYAGVRIPFSINRNKNQRSKLQESELDSIESAIETLNKHQAAVTNLSGDTEEKDGDDNLDISRLENPQVDAGEAMLYATTNDNLTNVQ